MQTFVLRDWVSRVAAKELEETELADVLRGLFGSVELPEGVWLAGGALRRTLLGHDLESDFDFFFTDEETMKRVKDDLAETLVLKDAREHCDTFTATIAGKTRTIQFIKISWYGDAESVIDSFDFTLCQFATNGHKLWCGDYAMFDTGRKRLAVHKITYPVASLRRLLKYTRQGFYACNGCLAALLASGALMPDTLTYVD